jgi:hypothetical protein
LGGRKIGFGSEQKVTKIEKTYNPGPGSYILPGTVGNIPKYLMNSNKMAAKRIRKAKTNISLDNYG